MVKNSDLNKKIGREIKKNPPWKRDEVILALDLYFSLNPNEMSPINEKVIKLSHILNSLPIHDGRSNYKNFRNPNSIVMKLGNFKNIDPNYPGKGLKAGNKLDELIWNEFHLEKRRLNDIAESIATGVEILEKVEHLFTDIEEEEFPEGKILYRLHKSYERNSTLIKKKKKIALEKNNLKCEICGFNFKEVYGELGEGYIECHHVVPISQYKDVRNTNLNNLILVCSNCHRMLHRKRPWLSRHQLELLIQQK